MIAPEQIPVPPVRGGSVEICMYEIAKRLAQTHQVTLISRRHRKLPVITRQGNLTIIRVRSGRGSRLYLNEVKKQIKGRQFDWIQIDNRPKFVPPIRRLFPHTPISLFLHSLTFVSGRRLTRKAALSCFAKTDMVVANSASLKTNLAVRFPGLISKLHYVWLGTDLQRFRPPTAEERETQRRRYKLGNAFTISFVGRLIPRKGLPLLMKAARIARKQHPNLKLVVAGGSTVRGYAAKLKRLARKSKLPVVFLGSIPHRRVHRVYWMADCFVCPSQQHEAFGLVNVEAMASTLPCIASNIGGISEIIHDGDTGMLVNDYKNPHAFAAKLLAVINQPSLYEQVGARAREDIINRFNWNTTAEQLAALYKTSAYTNGEEEQGGYEVDRQQMDQDGYTFPEFFPSAGHSGDAENDQQQIAGDVE